MDNCLAVSAKSEAGNEYVAATVSQLNEGSEAGISSPSETIEGAALPFSKLPPTHPLGQDEIGFASFQAKESASARENIAKEAQQLIEDLNAKRRQDTQLIEDFKKSVELHLLKSCKTIEEAMFGTYEKQSSIMQSKLQELFAALDRISQLENELRQFRASLGIFFQDMSE